MFRILLTGATGFVGQAIFQALISQGHTVFTTGKANEQCIKNQPLSYTFYGLDWNSISPIDIVFHQAAITNTLHTPASDFYLVNTEYSKKLFKDAVKNKVKKFIYASSCAVYGKGPFKENFSSPLNDYGISKLLFDEWVMGQSDLVKIGLRYSNVYGLNEGHKGKSASMVWQLKEKLISGKTPQLFKWGEQSRDFVCIDDVVQANLLAMNSESGIYNVGSGQNTTFNDLYQILSDILNVKSKIEYIDNPHQEQYQEYTCCNLEKSNRELGYYPKFSIQDGIKKYFKIANDDPSLEDCYLDRPCL